MHKSEYSWDIADYPPQTWTLSECVTFRRINHDFGELSNFYPLSVEDHRGVIWPTAEALYQAAKFDRHKHAGVREEIRKSKEPYAAKHIAYRERDLWRPDWQDMKIRIMRLVLVLKVRSNVHQILTVLDRTGTRPIVEIGVSEFWAARLCSGYHKDNAVGRNVLGCLWTEIRDSCQIDRASIVG